MQVALSILVIGLFIGVVAGPSGPGHAGLNVLAETVTDAGGNPGAAREIAAASPIAAGPIEDVPPRVPAAEPPPVIATPSIATPSSANSAPPPKPIASAQTSPAPATPEPAQVAALPPPDQPPRPAIKPAPAPPKAVAAPVRIPEPKSQKTLHPKSAITSTPEAPQAPQEPTAEELQTAALAPSSVIRRSVKVRSGDTLMSIMIRAGIDRDDAHDAVTALRKKFNPRHLKVGQQLQLTMSEEVGLEELLIDPSPVRQISVRRMPQNTFRAYESRKTLSSKLALARGKISSSLYKAAIRAGVPRKVLGDLVHIYSWDVDFQREIQPGDSFEVAYQKLLDEDGALVRYGDVVYARLTLSGDVKPLYRFKNGTGVAGYFDDKGRSAVRALMRTPIDGARLSSRFGKRRHPILGYTKMHRGVDFAAPTGTPIYAAGDGVIDRRGRNGAYGHYVRIRHNKRYSTAYAHLSRYKKGVTRGTRVRQGQVIGYVGSTGRSTGPHLHYEILVNGRRVNPLSVKMPSGKKLANKALVKFQRKRSEVDEKTAKLRKTKTAALQR